MQFLIMVAGLFVGVYLGLWTPVHALFAFVIFYGLDGISAAIWSRYEEEGKDL